LVNPFFGKYHKTIIERIKLGKEYLFYQAIKKNNNFSLMGLEAVEHNQG
jgi:hypothetical protein